MLSSLDPSITPSQVQGVYRYDCSAYEWKFWAPGAPGCTLTELCGGYTHDYLVCGTGSCNWEIPLAGAMPTPLPPPVGPHECNFCSAGFFPRHLPDSYTGTVVLADLDLGTIPDEVQGVYWWNGDEWLFWAPGAPGCTLPALGGGHTYDYMVAVTGGCEWEIPLP